ncbi:MAG: pglF 1 [Firmicutes bacterium]|nr:pglF 1 [Bacillota bacterium]
MRYLILCSALMITDAAIVALTPFVALYIRFEGNIEPSFYATLVDFVPVVVVVQMILLYLFRLYRRLWRYAGINELFSIVGSVTLGSVMLAIIAYGMGIILPRSMFLLSGILNIACIGLSRICVRLVYHWHRKRYKQCSNVLIVGAGDVGASIAKEIKDHYGSSKKIIGFIDDDPAKIGHFLLGEKVLGNRDAIHPLVAQHHVQEIIIAIPSANGTLVREIVQVCRQTKCSVKVVPAVYEILDGMVTMRQLRDVNLEDLLRRDPVRLDTSLVSKYLADKRILVTGAGGSIGSELCRQIAKMAPRQLILLGKSENNICDIQRELQWDYPKLRTEAIIANVCDEKRINTIFARFYPQVVFHAAAHKHVPLMETQPDEAVKNNIFGTKVVAEAAVKADVERFVMISTDKAVNPTSIMGATKRVAEMIICGMNTKPQNKFMAVRFGNVLGSRGSVIPLFRKQIVRGGPVTITHPDMQRYFMTIPEAAQLVLQAGAMAQGGEVFILDMGKPIRILDMACDLIELTGLVPYKDIKIEFTGLRPGEKLFEEILTAEEGSNSTKHEKIYVANLRAVDPQKLNDGLTMLRATDEPEKISSILCKLIPTFVRGLPNHRRTGGCNEAPASAETERMTEYDGKHERG